MSDDSRRKEDEAPAEIEEARQARELSESMEGRGANADEEALAAAAQVAAARSPELSAQARSRIGDELFGSAASRRSWRGWAVAAGVVFAVGTAGLLTLRDTLKRTAPAPGAPVAQVDAPQEGGLHRQAELLVAQMMPQPTAAERAEALANRLEAKLEKEAAP